MRGDEPNSNSSWRTEPILVEPGVTIHNQHFKGYLQGTVKDKDSFDRSEFMAFNGVKLYNTQYL